MEYGLIVTVLCLAIVFGVLAFLILALYGMQYFTKQRKPASDSDSDNNIEQIKQSNNTTEQTDSRVIAVIAAAIQAYYEAQPETKKAKFIVRSIKRI